MKERVHDAKCKSIGAVGQIRTLETFDELLTEVSHDKRNLFFCIETGFMQYF